MSRIPAGGVATGVVRPCGYCVTPGENEHGNPCEICDGTGLLEEYEGEWDEDDEEGGR